MALLVVTGAALLGAAAGNLVPGPPPTIANPNPLAGKQFSTEYTAEYFDVYSNPIRTRYAEVHWTSHGNLPLPEAIVERFRNKTMAIVGYEVDQVYQTPDGEEPVPITSAYNHHYGVWIFSPHATMVHRHAHGSHRLQGCGSVGGRFWDAVTDRDAPHIDGGIPHTQFFSEGNGGEMRRSYHGYPKGYAQLMWSPTKWSVTPMQVDTKNREHKGKGFKAGPLPRSSLAPPNASYSGLVECPCTTRIRRESYMAYAALREGSCGERPQNASECFMAAGKVAQSAGLVNRTVHNSSMPPGCSIDVDEAIWNDADSSITCGNGGAFQRVVGTASSVVNLTVDLQQGDAGAEVTITISGPAAAWFGAGFGADSMCQHWDADECSGGPYAIIVSGDSVVERRLALHGAGAELEPSVVVKSNAVLGEVRTVVLTRPFQGKTPQHFSFDISKASEKYIAAFGHDLNFARHARHAGGTMSFQVVGQRSCICRDGMRHSINGRQFPYPSACQPAPASDLLTQHNPSCYGETYSGGLWCCVHGELLLDADQDAPAEIQEYRLKFRFYFEEYTPGPTPSHTNLIRLYHQTEYAQGEYDIVPCLPGTPAQECVQVITARWKVRDMMQPCSNRDGNECTGKDSTDATKIAGVHLIYAGPHCHAPDCLSMELYNADTGRLLCSMAPEFGASDEVYDELGYVALPPCLWGDAEEGLQPPELLSLDTELLSIKRNNNTIGHYGEMASWQMRGVLIPREPLPEEGQVVQGWHMVAHKSADDDDFLV